MALAVRPTLTPMAVTMPGHQRHSSMMGMSCMAALSASPMRRSLRVSAGAPSFAAPSCSRRRLKRAFAASSSPKVRIILRRMS
jgi:hypothetical protein